MYNDCIAIAAGAIQRRLSGDRLTFHRDELTYGRFHRIIGFRMFGVGTAPLGELRRMVDPPVDTTGQRVHIVHGEQRIRPAARTGRPRSATTRRSPAPDRAGHAFDDTHRFEIGDRRMHQQIAGTQQRRHVGSRWNPIRKPDETTAVRAIRCNLFLSGPVPAITNSMSCA